jgi:ubiquinone/menaquinone biosynthesis C-methylase UbiE
MFYERVWRPIVSRLFFFGRSMNAVEERRIVLGMLDVSTGQRIIDVGCGPGNYTRDLGRVAGSGLVVGVDAWEPMLTAAVLRGGGENLAYVRGDACSLPFRDESFDVACSVGVIHMVENPLAALDEMVRVLAPGGKLAVAVSCSTRPGGRSLRHRLGLKVFGPDEVTSFFTTRGLNEIKQRVVGQGQFVSAHKPVG